MEEGEAAPLEDGDLGLKASLLGGPGGRLRTLQSGGPGPTVGPDLQGSPLGGHHEDQQTGHQEGPREGRLRDRLKEAKVEYQNLPGLAETSLSLGPCGRGQGLSSRGAPGDARSCQDVVFICRIYSIGIILLNH